MILPFTSQMTLLGPMTPVYRAIYLHPEEENLLFLLYYFFIPNLKLNSMTFILILINIFCFIFTLSFGLEPTALSTFLTPKYVILNKLGAFNPTKIHKNYFHLYRLITFQFLHINIESLFYDLILLACFLSTIEKIIGKTESLLLYLFCGIIGNLYYSSDFIYDEFSVGANSSVYGILGYYMTFFIINWNYYKFFYGWWMVYYTWMMVFEFTLVFGILMIGIEFTNVDSILIGFLSGCFLMLMDFNKVFTLRNQRKKKFICFGIGAFFLFLILLSTIKELNN
jgi:rhomboid protease GluP